MPNLSIIRDLCKEKNVSLRELSNEIGITENGLQLIMKSNNAKFDVVEKISRYLKVSIIIFTDDDIFNLDNRIQNEFLIPEYLFIDDSLNFLSKRLLKFTEIIMLYKDYYLFRIAKAIHAGFDPEYKLLKENFTKKVFLNDTFKKKFIEIGNEVDLEGTPFSRLSSVQRDKIDNTLVFDGFYFPIFDRNFKNITEYLEDGMINDPEILEYWKTWKSK